MGSTGKKQTFLGWRKMILCHFKTSWVYCSATKSGNFRTKKNLKVDMLNKLMAAVCILGKTSLYLSFNKWVLWSSYLWKDICFSKKKIRQGHLPFTPGIPQSGIEQHTRAFLRLYLAVKKNTHKSHHPYMDSKITPENMPGTKQKQRTRQRKKAANKDWENKQAEHAGVQGYLSSV